MNNEGISYRVARVTLQLEGEHPAGLGFFSEDDPRDPDRFVAGDSGPSLDEKYQKAEADAKRVRRAEEAFQWVSCAITPITDHLASLGAIRADNCSNAIFGSAGACHDPTFFIVYECSPQASAHLVELGNLEAALAGVSCDELVEFDVSADFLTVDDDPLLIVQAVFNAMPRREAFAGVGIWGGTGTPERLPQEDEGLSGWLERVALSETDLAAMAERWEVVGRDIDLFNAFGSHLECGGPQEVEFLVPGVLARGAITSLVGTNGVGKSTIAHEWAAILTGEPLSRPRKILGKAVDGCPRVALVSGEDGPGRVNERSNKLSTVWGVSRYYRFDGTSRSWDQIYTWLERAPQLDLVILDPVRVAMTGNEDLSGDASNFYDDLSRLARIKKCAVLVVHHLSKGHPRRLSDLRGMVRGSGVHVDRPRMVIGIIGRANGAIEIGPIKHNFDPDTVWSKLNEGTLYQRDPASDTLIPLAEMVESSANQDRTSRVLAAIARLNDAGQIVRRSGKTGLFEMRLPEMSGLSRNVILETIEELAQSGSIAIASDGGLVAQNTD
ncbi:AAA family ATPase [Croceicoccus mobilis]|uniref:AAA+ ATPase domain-containing protein n=1 Tax=Croceicoccus mobilis TaxID=1703339 RepID=A0A916YSG7_9SPHN|nr:AAA family ATPase [Croceicoccus mobilis]GGD58711.1 hypothetical protein GCM10010990_04950 [Croceicoccus mobilis]